MTDQFFSVEDTELLQLTKGELLDLFNSTQDERQYKASSFSSKGLLLKRLNSVAQVYMVNDELKAIRHGEIPPPSAEETAGSENSGGSAEQPTKVDDTEDSRISIGARVQQLLLMNMPPWSYREILDQIKQEYPEAKTTANCLRWYAAELKELGVKMPPRPRSNWKD